MYLVSAAAPCPQTCACAWWRWRWAAGWGVEGGRTCSGKCQTQCPGSPGRRCRAVGCHLSTDRPPVISTYIPTLLLAPTYLHQHLLSHLWNLTSSSYPIDSVCVRVCACVCACVRVHVCACVCGFEISPLQAILLTVCVHPCLLGSLF